MTITREKALEIYEISTFAKQLDDKVQQLLMAGTIKTSWFSWRGSELLGAVVGLSMRTDDYLIAYYRDAMSQMAKGSSPKKMFAEALGKVTGSQKGKSGWVHSVDLDAGVVMNSGVIGGQLPVAAGWALSSVIRGDDRVTVCNLGDGAANEGAFHEAMTLASIWKLPVVYVCHNNLYSEHTAFAKTSPVKHVVDRLPAYDIPTALVDGGDVPSTWAAVNEALDRARSGGGPSFIEAMTYRFHGHTRFDTMSYIPAGEVAAHVNADPVLRFRNWLVEMGHAIESDLDRIDQQAAMEVQDVWEFADKSPYPEVDELYSNVFA